MRGHAMTMGEAKRPGQRLVPNYIDAMAMEHPGDIAIDQILSYGANPVHIQLTYCDLARVINKVAWWIQGEVSSQGYAEEGTIAYLGPSDVRHIIVSIAAVKASLKALLLSPRNSVSMHEHLLKETKCQALFYDSRLQSVADDVTISNPGIKATQMLDLKAALLQNLSAVKEYPFQTSFHMASGRPLAILHTSGSTGMPKPVPFVHGAMAALDCQRELRDPSNPHLVCQYKVIEKARNVYNALPLFHVAGLGIGLYVLLSGLTMVLGPPERPPSGEVFKQIFNMSKMEGAVIPPAVVDQISEDLSLVETVMPQLEFVFFGGGPIRKATGDKISGKTCLLMSMGSTECGSIISFMMDRENWNYYHFCEAQAGIRWDPVSYDGLSNGENKGRPQYFEMVICRDEQIVQNQAVFHIFPGIREWRTKDLYRRHPTNPNYWSYVGRTDDIIVLSTGEKISPMPVEEQVSSVRRVKSCLVVGKHRPYPILLIELVDDNDKDDNAIIEEVRAVVKEINKQSSRDAHINDRDIIIASKEKPFARLAKGTINRGQTETLYADEIDRAYQALTRLTLEQSPLIDPTSKETTERTILQIIRDLTGAQDLSSHDDFFSRGLDSRQVQMLATSLSRAFSEGRRRDPSSFRQAVYLNPTVSQLVENIIAISATIPQTPASGTFNALLQKYTRMQTRTKCHQRTAQQRQRRQHNLHHILLTGSTGFIGTYLLEALRHHHPKIRTITCLDRRAVKEIEPDFPRIRRLQGSLSEPQFGLPKETYTDLLQTVTKVIHCQWPVNFHWPLPLFEPQIHGVANLIDFAQSVKCGPLRIVFLSSIATVQGWNHDQKNGSILVPEQRLVSQSYAQPGYGESKLLASELLHQAAMENMSVTICRVGQVAGPISGTLNNVSWPVRDWFPTLVRTAREISCLPDSLGSAEVIDWIPVDVLVGLLVDLTFADDNNKPSCGTTTYRHLVNPSVVTYRECVLPVLLQKLTGEDCEVVPLPEWIRRVERAGGEGLELLEFYRGLANASNQTIKLDTKFTVAELPSLGSIGPVCAAWVETWLDQLGLGAAR